MVCGPRRRVAPRQGVPPAVGRRSVKIVGMTLLLTCVTHRFSVQASDRRLTDTRGSVVEELANKATLLCNFASFAYTGLARCSVVERTDQLLMRSLAEPGAQVAGLIEKLRVEATRAMRQVPLRASPADRLVIRRTSFVGCGFVTLRNLPVAFSLESTPDGLYPFLAVVSNAQDLTESWRAVADREFAAHIDFVELSGDFRLHVAGQQLLKDERIELQRAIRHCLVRVKHPEPIARLLSHAIRRVSLRNRAVGPNVMCTIVRRADATQWEGRVSSAPMPIVAETQNEASYFRRTRDGPSPKWIFSPADPAQLVHYGPNVACNGLQMTGLRFGPSSIVDKTLNQ